MRIPTLMPVPSEISTSPERRTQCLMYYRDIGQRKLLWLVGAEAKLSTGPWTLLA